MESSTTEGKTSNAEVRKSGVQTGRARNRRAGIEGAAEVAAAAIILLGRHQLDQMRLCIFNRIRKRDTLPDLLAEARKEAIAVDRIQLREGAADGSRHRLGHRDVVLDGKGDVRVSGEVRIRKDRIARRHAAAVALGPERLLVGREPLQEGQGFLRM